jgi:hypothetical protein
LKIAGETDAIHDPGGQHCGKPFRGGRPGAVRQPVSAIAENLGILPTH